MDLTEAPRYDLGRSPLDHTQCGHHRTQDGVRVAFVVGSVAKGFDAAGSDVDLMVISAESTCADPFRALEAASSQLARNVNPTIYTLAELARRGDEHASFLVKVLEQPKILIIGEKMTSPLEHLEASAQL
ncbi:MAG: nucleotidyltransferase domain-containing protein, partial [Gemmatimonadota bacterium]